MRLQPWYKVVTPREDLREGRPLDASEFAVHLDQVRDRRAPDVYQNPEEFFERTYLTENLAGLAAQVIRRLAGEKTETSAIFNLSTQFGGGKTHALTLLYHLAENGPAANDWRGVHRLLSTAGLKEVPTAATAVFVGTEFDSLTGRGGDGGTPVRKTPWGEIAFQLGGKQALAKVAEHETNKEAPAGDVIRSFLPKGQPCLILLDELMNYVSRNRRSGLSNQLYHFLHNLYETARAENDLVVVVSMPASEIEMTTEDHSDYERFRKDLDRLGKAMFPAAETAASEIIRRRLFEWHGMPNDGVKVAKKYADWALEHRQQITSWSSVDETREAFESAYPFHPTVLSVFERKWQALPRFQRTRGVLRLLALWVSRAYQEGFRGAHRDPLIGLGTSPLDDPTFRAALFEQLGESGLDVAVTTDICGKPDSHADRLDREAVDTIRKARLHRKVAATIFFESNGGQTREEATLPEIRLGVGEPDLDIGNVETVLETLGDNCYFLTIERNRYRFSLSPNLNKILSDRLASMNPTRVAERVRYGIQQVFAGGSGVERVFFPERSNEIPDRPALTFAILAPDQVTGERDEATRMVESLTREHGTSARTFKSALIWCVPDATGTIRDEARKVLAWEDIEYEEEDLRLDDSQRKQLPENLKKARRDLKERIWQAYKNVMLLGSNNTLDTIDLGLVHSSAAESMVDLVLNHLRQYDEVQDYVSPNFLLRNWPPAFKEWSTKSVRNAFFASPQFPRLLNAEAVKDTIARGVQDGVLAYVGKTSSGEYEPFVFEEYLGAADVEISDDMFVITVEEARKHIEPSEMVSVAVHPEWIQVEPGEEHTVVARGIDQHDREIALPEEVVWSATGGTIREDGVFTAGQDEGSFKVTATVGQMVGTATVVVAKEGKIPPPDSRVKKLRWTNEVSPQKWMSLYTKVLSKFAVGHDLKLTLSVEVSSPEEISAQTVEETKVALRELGLNDDVETE